MGKNKRLPNDTVLAALQLVRGQARRKAEYKRQVDEIIPAQRHKFCGYHQPAAARPCVCTCRAPAGIPTTSPPTRPEAIQQLETQRDVQIMRAIDAAADEIGADIQNSTVRAALQKAIALNCKDCRTWTYERLEVPGISRIEFYRRRRKYLENVAQRVGNWIKIDTVQDFLVLELIS